MHDPAQSAARHAGTPGGSLVLRDVLGTAFGDGRHACLIGISSKLRESLCTRSPSPPCLSSPTFSVCEQCQTRIQHRTSERERETSPSRGDKRCNEMGFPYRFVTLTATAPRCWWSPQAGGNGFPVSNESGPVVNHRLPRASNN